MGSRQQLRGRLARAAQRWVTRPCRRRFPFGVWRRLHAVNRRLFPDRFTDADPFTVVFVDPTRITQSILEHSPRYPQWGLVADGDWDQRGTPFTDRTVYRGLVERFENGDEWEETVLYDAFLDQLDRFGNAWGYTTRAGFEQRCQEIEQLYERIDRDGYWSQARLRRAGVTATPILDEVNVDIGRDGSLLWRGYGQHRLAIAKLLDIDAIPVLFHRRHRGWQATRDAVRAGSEPAVDRSHPDLRDIEHGNEPERRR